MYTIIYRSTATPGFDLAEVLKMLSNARSRNAEQKITGCLLYHENQFAQLIEGEKDAVIDLFSKIQKDKRHTEVELLKEVETDERIFIDWDMAFHDFGNPHLGAHYKLHKVTKIFNRSEVFETPNQVALDFFKITNNILFSKN